MYGLNDYNDVKADAVNPRKGNYLFGAKYSEKDLSSVLNGLFGWCCLSWSFFLGIRLDDAGVIGLHDWGECTVQLQTLSIEGAPPFEIVIQSGYVFVVFFSARN